MHIMESTLLIDFVYVNGIGRLTRPDALIFNIQPFQDL